MATKDYDLVVLGGGNSVTTVFETAKTGMRVALVEATELGGTCPNRGCVPTKLLLGYADRADQVRRAGRFHVSATLDGIDGEALLAETFAATRRTDGKLEGALPENVTLHRGRGVFVGDRTLEVHGENAHRVTVRGERVLVATGSRPRRPDVPGLAGTPYWTSDDVFEMTSLPASVAIVGGGYIGCELGHFFNGVGVDTTVVHRGSELLEAADEEIRPRFQAGFTERVPTLLNTSVTRVSHNGERFTLELEGGGGAASELVVERLLYAIGRVPNSDRIGLDVAGVEVGDRGFVVVDERLATTAPGVFALGDVAGNYMFTHSATYEASYLARCFVTGGEEPIDYGAVPSVVFTAPEVASAGPTEQKLRADGVPYLAASVPYTSAAKGRAIKEEHGLCKFLVTPGGEILGVHIVGEHASVLLHEVVPVMKWRNHISSLTEIIHVHPSLSEVVRNAARKVAGSLSAHRPNPVR